jgi:hypothetical protein
MVETQTVTSLETQPQGAVIRQTDDPSKIPPEYFARSVLSRGKKFLVRNLLIERTPIFYRQTEEAQAAPRDQVMKSPDVLVRLVSDEQPTQKVRILQRWIGRIERIESESFVAVINDLTKPQYPPEEVELDRGEIPPGDVDLLIPGAAFYWTIGYVDSPGGQRQRVSAFRFVRQPRLSQTEMNRIMERADRLATFLET